MSAALQERPEVMNSPPRVDSLWSPDGLDICEVRATWADGVVVKWIERRIKRPCIYTPLSSFYSQFSRHVKPFDPTTCVDRFMGLD